MVRCLSSSPSTLRYAASGLVLSALLSCSHAKLDPTSNSPLGVFWGPAPAPEDGPPLSFNASRDKSLLPAQIGAIIGAYIFVVLVVGASLLLIGRRLRAQAESSGRTLDVEMIKPSVKTKFDPSPVSPASQRNWPSPSETWSKWTTPKSGRSPTSPDQRAPNFSWPSPTKAEFGVFDQRVIDDDKARGERDMDRLYAAVMAHDEANEAKVVYDARTQPQPPQYSRQQPTQVGPPPPPPQQQQHQQQQQQQRQEPFKRKTPPPVVQVPHPGLNAMRPTPTPTSAQFPSQPASPRQHSRKSSLTSLASKRKSKSQGIRGLTISSPIPTPTFSMHSRQMSDEEPLTPRFPPPSPPIPHHHHHRQQQAPPPSQSQSHTQTQARYPQQRISPSSPTATIDSELRSFPARHPSSHPTAHLAPARGGGAGGSLPSPTPSASASRSAAKPLPLRQYSAGPTSPAASDRTTVTMLERPLPAQRNAQGALLSPNPGTAGAVPYSPYMPFSPITPITPRLETRADRKARERAEGREVVRQMTKSEGELWDSAY